MGLFRQADAGGDADAAHLARGAAHGGGGRADRLAPDARPSAAGDRQRMGEDGVEGRALSALPAARDPGGAGMGMALGARARRGLLRAVRDPGPVRRALTADAPFAVGI